MKSWPVIVSLLCSPFFCAEKYDEVNRKKQGFIKTNSRSLPPLEVDDMSKIKMVESDSELSKIACEKEKNQKMLTAKLKSDELCGKVRPVSETKKNVRCIRSWVSSKASYGLTLFFKL